MSKYMFVTPTLSVGGAQRAVSVLSSALAKLGQDVCVLKYYTASGEYPIDSGVKVISFVNDADEYQKCNIVQRIRFIRKTIKKEKPDFVIPFLFQVALAVDIAVKGLNVNVFQTIRNNPNLELSNKAEKFLRDRMVYKSKCTFVQNLEQKLYFNKKIHDKIHIIINPVCDEFFSIEHKGNSGEFIFCAAGRLSAQKNFELLIRSFIDVFDNNRNVKLIIYGEGELREKLQSIIDSSGYSATILLPGRTNDMIKAYSNADVFVLSSDYEGMPNALIEAMAAGVPSISTDCPTGPSDLVDDGENGILVPVGDEKALSQAMKKMFEDVNMREKFSVSGRMKIKEICSSENIAGQMIEICEANR
ncbi:MAG: glycosyltransferase [Oscillospiraceae bacterium]|nr:glycosyltransferase [Candidatus Equicaccousia limihippi]